MNSDERQWTLTTLHAHFVALLNAKEQRDDQRFAAQKEATNLALTAADRAVTKAETAAEKRFEAVNEFRSTLADQQRTLMPRAETELLIRGVLERINKLEDSQMRRAAVGQGLHLGWVVLIGLIGLMGTVIGIATFFR